MDINNRKVLDARSCYGHLGGTLGNRLFMRLIELGWFEKEESRATLYKITPKGTSELEKLGVDVFMNHNNRKED